MNGEQLLRLAKSLEIEVVCVLFVEHYMIGQKTLLKSVEVEVVNISKSL